MERMEFYLKIDVKGHKFDAMDLEQIIHESLAKKIGRNFKFPIEDVIVMPIEFLQREFKGVKE